MELENQLEREIDIRNACSTDCASTEKQLEKAIQKKSALDLKDKYTFQLQEKVHEELSASMKGYGDAYSTVMCDKMKTLEVKKDILKKNWIFFQFFSFQKSFFLFRAGLAWSLPSIPRKNCLYDWIPPKSQTSFLLRLGKVQAPENRSWPIILWVAELPRRDITGNRSDGNGK